MMRISILCLLLLASWSRCDDVCQVDEAPLFAYHGGQAGSPQTPFLIELYLSIYDGTNDTFSCSQNELESRMMELAEAALHAIELFNRVGGPFVNYTANLGTTSVIQK